MAARREGIIEYGSTSIKIPASRTVLAASESIEILQCSFVHHDIAASFTKLTFAPARLHPSTTHFRSFGSTLRVIDHICAPHVHEYDFCARFTPFLDSISGLLSMYARIYGTRRLSCKVQAAALQRHCGAEAHALSHQCT